MKGFVLISLLLISFAGFAQQSPVNNYKYVIVPERYPFTKEPNQYGLNALTQMVLNGKGFTAFMDNRDLPADLATNKCNGLTVDVQQRKALFVTNLTLSLKDCQGNVVWKSKEGKSREKEYAMAYNEALKDALQSLDTLDYKYNGTTFTAPQAPTAVVSQPAPTPAIAASTPVVAPAPVNNNSGVKTLYAQATDFGYQLVDTTPKKIMTLYKTTAQDYFIADNGNDSGIVLKQNGEWYFEYYKDNKLVTEKLAIKF